MKKLIYISIAVITFIGSITAQETTKATGEWLLTKIVTNGDYQNVGQLVDFNQDGKLYIQEMPFGTWSYNLKKNTLNLDAEKLSGSYDLEVCSDTNMQLTLKEKELYFTRINREKIQKDNEASGLIGLWEYVNEQEDQMHHLVQFKAPDEISLIEKDENMESRYSGIWFYKPEKGQLIIIGQMKGIRGINTEVTITENEVNFINNKIPTTLKKVKQEANKIEHLTFSEDDFYDEDGDYKYYDDEQKLPWQDVYEMIDVLQNVKQLVYKQSTLVEGTQSFETKTLKADVNASFDNEALSIDYIFDGYDRYNSPDDYQLPPNKWDSYASKLYPYKEVTYRVKGDEEVIVPAGTFTCTVVEALGSFDENIKMWMVNDKPGIIAKIIKDKPGSFGHYNIYELQEIK
jgi:hypothetical protein